MQRSASHEVKVALAAARRMRRPMPLLRAIMAAAEQAGAIDHAGASLIYGPDYAAVLAALLAMPADAASGAARRPASPLRAVATHTPERPSRGGGETGRAPGAPPRQAAALRAVADSRPAARSRAAPAVQRGDIAKARAELRRGRFSGGLGDVAPAATAIERRAEDAAGGRGTPPRPAAVAAPPGIGHGRLPDPGDGGGAGRGPTAFPPPATAEPMPAAYRHPADARADVSPEPEARPAALRAAALARGATIVEDAPAVRAALTDRPARSRREPPAPPAGRRRERAADPVAGAAPVAAAPPAPIAPPARHSPDAGRAASPGHSPDAAGAASVRRGKPVPGGAVSPPAVRHDPVKLDDAGTVLAEAAWRNGVDAA
jgi:hypothetical protein